MSWSKMENLEKVKETKRVAGTGLGDYKAPLFIAWQITSVCNLGCLHCCEESGHGLPDEMGHDDIFNFCKQIVKLEIPYAALSGGEPLLHPEFFPVCEFLRHHDVSLKVETNGLYVDKDVAKRFAQLQFRSVQVSVDGATAATHESLRANGDWKKVINACKALIAEGVNTEIVFVPTQFNIHETGQVIDLAASLGIYGIYTGKIMRIGRAAKNWSILCPTEEQYAQFFKVLEKKTDEYKGRMKVYYYPYDVIEELRYRLQHPSASLLIVPNGKVKLIGPLPFICGDVRKQGLEDVWARYKRGWREPQVIKYTKEVLRDPTLLVNSNSWIDLY